MLEIKDRIEKINSELKNVVSEFLLSKNKDLKFKLEGFNVSYINVYKKGIYSLGFDFSRIDILNDKGEMPFASSIDIAYTEDCGIELNTSYIGRFNITNAKEDYEKAQQDKYIIMGLLIMYKDELKEKLDAVDKSSYLTYYRQRQEEDKLQAEKNKEMLDELIRNVDSYLVVGRKATSSMYGELIIGKVTNKRVYIQTRNGATIIPKDKFLNDIVCNKIIFNEEGLN